MFANHTENCSDRITHLEQQQQASESPSDEQVERVLRKILAERFGESTTQPEPTLGQAKGGGYFVRPSDGISVPRAPPIDPMMLVVDPEAVPSKQYGQTFKLLEQGLNQYPSVKINVAGLDDTAIKEEEVFKHPKLPSKNDRP